MQAFVNMNVIKQQYSQPVGRFLFTQVHWQVDGQQQLHSPSRLNLFITMHQRNHLPAFVNNLYSKQQVDPNSIHLCRSVNEQQR